MRKSTTTAIVKKTLVRNCEQKIKEPLSRNVVYSSDVRDCNTLTGASSQISQKENELNEPTLCSSESLANFISDVKKSLPSHLSEEELKEEKKEISAKVTKKLNFHFNERMYKNLIELNATAADLNIKRDRRIPNRSKGKRDLEPNIEDFCDNEPESDFPPSVPVIRPRFKPIKKVENGQLHKLDARFDIL